jgi:hypothetical protein
MPVEHALEEVQAMTFMPVKPIVDGTRQLARSALPDAPVVPDEPKARVVRNLSARVLRVVARRQLRLAERMDPRRDRVPQPS